MVVPFWVWVAVVAGLVLVIMIDLVVVDRGEPHEFTPKKATFWVCCYVGAALAFGCGLLLWTGHEWGVQFFAGYLTEYSLSVDNLVVFLVIMNAFAVPKRYQHKALLIGVSIALMLRGIFILVGAVALQEFQWLLFVFGAFLIYGAIKMARGGGDEPSDPAENAIMRVARRVIPATDRYHRADLVTRVGSRRVATPLLVVVVVLGATDLLFAFDSIPAIFGLTKHPFIVFTANAFALMGLRQLYFLLGDLLNRLVYLNVGLAVILTFIGLKLVAEGLHSLGLHRIPDVPTLLSLAVIAGVLVLTALASILRTNHDRRAAERPE